MAHHTDDVRVDRQRLQAGAGHLYAQQADPRVTVGLPDKVAITITGGSPDSMDQSSANGICSYPPCYYYSWLYN